ncbi:MAG TPA: hypothetical protein VIJ41_15000, partial [Candidatus Nanopelagicales bacterium]
SGITSIPLYPQDRECGAPSAPRIFEIFSGLARHDLVSNGQIVQTFAPKLTRIQAQVLDLLKVPHSAYGITS